MSVNYPNNVAAARLQAVATLIDAGSGAGKLEIGTAGMASVLATITLQDPAASVTDKVLTILGTPMEATAANSGTAAAARIRDSANNDVVTGLTVGTSGSGADIIVGSTSISAGQTVRITAGAINHP